MPLVNLRYKGCSSVPVPSEMCLGILEFCAYIVPHWACILVDKNQASTGYVPSLCPARATLHLPMFLVVIPPPLSLSASYFSHSLFSPPRSSYFSSRLTSLFSYSYSTPIPGSRCIPPIGTDPSIAISSARMSRTCLSAVRSS